jgi:uncharacterized sodium:solute symporter family permease YidK
MRDAMTEDKNWRRAAARRFVVPLAIALVGLVVILATSGIAEIVGGGVVAVAVTIAVSLVFLEVGLSEDRERDERSRR